MVPVKFETPGPALGKMAWLRVAPVLGSATTNDHILYPNPNFKSEDRHSGLDWKLLVMKLLS